MKEILDRLIHEELLQFNSPVVPYTTNLTAAMALVEAAFEEGTMITFNRDLDGGWISHQSNWTLNVGPWRIWDDTKMEPSFKAGTLPLVACLAVLDSSGLLPEDIAEHFEYDSLMHAMRAFNPETGETRPEFTAGHARLARGESS